MKKLILCLTVAVVTFTLSTQGAEKVLRPVEEKDAVKNPPGKTNHVATPVKPPPPKTAAKAVKPDEKNKNKDKDKGKTPPK